MSHNPGMRNFPRPSMSRAPDGILALAAGPTKLMRLPETSTVLSGSVAPETTSITDTWVIAIASCRAGDPPQAVAARSAIAIPVRAICSCALPARFRSVASWTVDREC
jgi:hypothetical protein